MPVSLSDALNAALGSRRAPVVQKKVKKTKKTVVYKDFGTKSNPKSSTTSSSTTKPKSRGKSKVTQTEIKKMVETIFKTKPKAKRKPKADNSYALKLSNDAVRSMETIAGMLAIDARGFNEPYEEYEKQKKKEWAQDDAKRSRRLYEERVREGKSVDMDYTPVKRGKAKIHEYADTSSQDVIDPETGELTTISNVIQKSAKKGKEAESLLTKLLKDADSQAAQISKLKYERWAGRRDIYMLSDSSAPSDVNRRMYFNADGLKAFLQRLNPEISEMKTRQGKSLSDAEFIKRIQGNAKTNNFRSIPIHGSNFRIHRAYKPNDDEINTISASISAEKNYIALDTDLSQAVEPPKRKSSTSKSTKAPSRQEKPLKIHTGLSDDEEEPPAESKYESKHDPNSPMAIHKLTPPTAPTTKKTVAKTSI